jgi:hypothetical protein
MGTKVVETYIEKYMFNFFDKASGTSSRQDKRIAVLNHVTVKQAVLNALGGWAGLVPSEEIKNLNEDKRRSLRLTRGLFKLLSAELLPWITDLSKISVQYFNLRGRYTFVLEHGLDMVNVWDSLHRVLTSEQFVHFYLYRHGFGLANPQLPRLAFKAGCAGSDPMVLVVIHIVLSHGALKLLLDCQINKSRLLNEHKAGKEVHDADSCWDSSPSGSRLQSLKVSGGGASLMRKVAMKVGPGNHQMMMTNISREWEKVLLIATCCTIVDRQMSLIESCHMAACYHPLPGGQAPH